MNAQSPRSRAIARQDDQIAQNVATIEAQRARPTAIQAMAGRLNISPQKLQETLRNTVFSKANDHEFAALIVVANEYGLNPLTKEIFAFPAKGGGIVPVVSVDGWIRIMNEHPQFDGIEFNDIVDQKGDLEAIEAVIYRKDRSRPIKVTEYLDECRRTDTEPWKKWPSRMLRHKALIQGARLAFGFSGITDGDDETVIIPGGDLELMRSARMPNSNEMLAHDQSAAQQEGEEDEDTARALDAGFDPRTGEMYGEGPADEQRGEVHTEAQPDDISPSEARCRDLIARIEAAASAADLRALDTEFTRDRVAFDDEQVAAIEAALADRRKAAR